MKKIFALVAISMSVPCYAQNQLSCKSQEDNSLLIVGITQELTLNKAINFYPYIGSHELNCGGDLDACPEKKYQLYFHNVVEIDSCVNDPIHCGEAIFPENPHLNYIGNLQITVKGLSFFETKYVKVTCIEF